MKHTAKALLVTYGILASALGVGVGTTPAHAQAKTITLCWAAWDPANALVELSRVPHQRLGRNEVLLIKR
jgi:multiple sugar transport system substrate-binding protein